MILLELDMTVDPCCDNVVGLVFGDLWLAMIFILCFVYFDLNGWSASTQCPRWPRSSTMTTTLHGFTKCDCANKFFLAEGNKNILIHKEKSPFPFSTSANRDFEIFKKAVLYFCGEQSLAEVKGLGRSMDCSARLCPSWKKAYIELRDPGDDQLSENDDNSSVNDD